MKHAFLLMAALTTWLSAEAKTVTVGEPYTYRNYVTEFRSAIARCVAEGADTLSLERGRYDIWTDGAERRELYITSTSTESECPSKVKTLGIVFDSVSNLTIEGNGSTIYFHGSMTPMAFIHCKGIKVHNLHVDFERPGATEMTVLDTCGGHVDVLFHRDSRWEIDPSGRIHLYGEGWQSEIIFCAELDPVTDHMRSTGFWGKVSSSKAVTMGGDTVRFMSETKTAPGTVVTLRDIIRREVGTFACESEDLTFDSVHMHYMQGLGMVFQRCRNVTMNSVECVPREGSGRILAASADFMHFTECCGLVSIKGCRFCGAHDDPINVRGVNMRAVEKIGESTLKVRFMHGQTYGFQLYSPGDTVAFVAADALVRTGYAVVKSAEMLSPYDIEVTLDRTVPEDFRIGLDAIENMTMTPEVEIRDNLFTRVPTRGLLVTTPRRVVISGNVFRKTAMAGILICADAMDWYDSGPVNDVLITGNRFEDCNFLQGAAIVLEPTVKRIDSTCTSYCNIRIIGNEFDLHGRAALKAVSVSGLVFKDNKLIGASEKSVILEGCSKTQIQ